MNMKKSFTLIEILISISITSIVITGMIKIHQSNYDMAFNMLKRNGDEMANSLFLLKDIKKYKGKEKNSYSLLKGKFNIKSDKVKDILKNIKKNIYIGKKEKNSFSKESSSSFNFISNEILLKGLYSSRYYQFNLKK